MKEAIVNYLRTATETWLYIIALVIFIILVCSFFKKLAIKIRGFDKEPIKKIEATLSELLRTQGCIEDFMGNCETKSIIIMEMDKPDEYHLRLFATQSYVCPDEGFYLQIFFKSGERAEWRSNQHDKSENWTNWNGNQRWVVFDPISISDADLYEDTVEKASYKIIKDNLPKILDAIKQVITNYEYAQFVKKENFEKNLSEEK